MMKILIMLLLINNLNTYAQSTQDKEAVNKAVSSFMDSWNKHDFTNIDTYTTADFSYINPPGILFKNRSEVENNLQSRHQTIFKNTPLKEESREVRFITPNVAIVTLVDTMGAETDRPGEERQIRTFVVVKQKEKWMLTASQATVISANARPNISTPTK